MAALTDGSFGIGAEVTWGTAVTPTRWYEASAIEFDINLNRVQGEGMRVGSVFARADRRQTPTADASGTMTMEATTRGMGLLWESCTGQAGVSTLVSGSTYQQNHTVSTSTPNMLGRTVQIGTVDTTGTVNPITYEGACVAEWTFTLDNAGLATLETQWDAENWNTGTALTAPTYTASNNLFNFGQATLGLGGAYTAATTTAMPTAATANVDVRSFSLTVNNGLSVDRFNVGGSGRKSRQLAGMRTGTGTLEIEYTGNTVRDLFLADTSTPVVLTLTSTEALSSGFATLAIALPAVRFNGETPKPNRDGITTLSVDFDVLFDGTNAPVAVSQRTADSAV
jgi:hypothetical protein